VTLLSRKADYALLVLSHLHHHPDGANAREIAEKFQLSRAFIANILKELCQKEFVSSTRGVKGGYILRRPATSVTLAELLESIEDGFSLTVCSSHHAGGAENIHCDIEHLCTVKSPMMEIHRRLMGVLRGVTLADVFSPAGFGNLQPLSVISRPMPMQAQAV